MLNQEQVKLYAEKYALTLDADGHETADSKAFWDAEPVLNDTDRKAIAEEVAYILKGRAEACDTQDIQAELTEASEAVSE